MARDREFTGLGTAPLVAKMLGSTAPVTGLTGAGTSSQSAALALTSNFSAFSTVASNSGARLPAAGNQGPYMVVNGGANALLVYPATGEKINNGSANGSFSVTNAKSAIFIPIENQWFAILSA